MSRVVSFGQRYQTEAQPPQMDPDPDDADPGLIMVPPIVLESVKVPVVLEVDPGSVRDLAAAIAAHIRSAVAAAVLEGLQDAAQIELVADDTDDGDPSSDRSA